MSAEFFEFARVSLRPLLMCLLQFPRVFKKLQTDVNETRWGFDWASAIPRCIFDGPGAWGSNMFETSAAMS